MKSYPLWNQDVLLNSQDSMDSIRVFSFLKPIWYMIHAYLPTLRTIGPSKLPILRTLTLLYRLYRFKPFHWRVLLILRVHEWLIFMVFNGSVNKKTYHESFFLGSILSWDSWIPNGGNLRRGESALPWQLFSLSALWDRFAGKKIHQLYLYLKLWYTMFSRYIYICIWYWEKANIL